MLNLAELKSGNQVVKVEPSDNIFEELGRNTYDYKDLLSELIDNSIAASKPGRLLEVNIDVFIDQNGKPKEFVIKDNARGIPDDILGIAIAPAGRQSQDSLNEHGLGMKQAVAALGKLKYLLTKTEEEAEAKLVNQFRFGEIPVYRTSFDNVSGTEIALTELKPVVTANQMNYTRTLIPYLGARYRRFLKPDDLKMNLVLNIKNIEPPHKLTYTKTVTQIKPSYLHPGTRRNEPVIRAHRIEGNGWAALLTFGYAPTHSEEYEELGIEVPNKFQPYKVSISTQGLDIIFQDRVILFHQLSEIGLVATRHNDYNNIRGEIDLKYGFSTAITKNSIIQDANFAECITRIKRILSGEDPLQGTRLQNYLVQRTYPDEIPEKLLVRRLIHYLSSNPLQKRQIIRKEFVVEGIEGYVDIWADGEAWEVKTDQANAQDVYQLFMYMDVGNINIGYLVAKSFTTGAEVAVDHIKAKHGVEITLASRVMFPINQPPTDQERADFY